MAHVDGELAGFMLQETGDTLYVVVQYDSDSWRFRYVRDEVRERIEEWGHMPTRSSRSSDETHSGVRNERTSSTSAHSTARSTSSTP